MKEYGSNIQKLVEHIISVPDKEKRTKHAHILIELMRQIHPQMRDGSDYSKKLWDDLYIMADFNLDVDSPYPPPPKEILGKRPSKMPYRQKNLKHKYYGRNIELLILKAIATESYDERKAFVSYLVKLMQASFLAWNKDTVQTNSVLQHILEMSEYKLQKEVDAIKEDGLVPDANPKDGNRVPNRYNNAQTFRKNQNGNSNSSSGKRYNKKNSNSNSKYSKPRRRY
jgi:biotin operon repressor